MITTHNKTRQRVFANISLDRWLNLRNGTLKFAVQQLQKEREEQFIPTTLVFGTFIYIPTYLLTSLFFKKSKTMLNVEC
jgi:hypothetical protein